MISEIAPKLVSKLGSTDSKIPLGIKDTFNSAGYTYFSYDAGGGVEGKDRFVDEFGTGAIWLFGIPLYKKIVDKTIFKFAKISPEADVRVVKDKKYLNLSIKHAPTDEILKDLKTAGKNIGKTKALTLAKFGISMALTMLSYLGLTKLKQKMTRLNIEKEFNENMKSSGLQEKTNELKNIPVNKKSGVFSEFENFSSSKKSKYNPSFGSGIKTAEEFILNPVKNMILLDVGITGERLSTARTEGEFKEYGIKEGSFLFFVYCAGELIKKSLETASQKLFKIPVALDAQLLSSDFAKDILTNNEMQKEIKNFSAKFTKNTDNSELYKFLFNNQNHTVVNAAKKSGIISTVKTKDDQIKIDTRKYIDPDKINQLVKNLEDYIKFGKKSKDINKYLDKVRILKVAATVLSIGASCLSLGYLVPKYMYEFRHKQQDGNRDFHVKTEYEKELAAKAAKKY